MTYLNIFIQIAQKYTSLIPTKRAKKGQLNTLCDLCAKPANNAPVL
jgi:hypothetical protein